MCLTTSDRDQGQMCMTPDTLGPSVQDIIAINATSTDIGFVPACAYSMYKVCKL